ncbi:MAG: hypothetical protein OYL41_02730 [Acidobacteriota bacterium]|nr:hypothetical protein [Acidobacteriota bacterium]
MAVARGAAFRVAVTVTSWPPAPTSSATVTGFAASVTVVDGASLSVTSTETSAAATLWAP